ncbi:MULTISPECIES: hypothetical protein [unclassified Bradyrhizobium]|uniref:hypothetical protein n=1 Tax=unclassified Bradyrhizobium TaxID=2631580 RepID=UPI0029160B0C|nr:MULTISPECIES: hypothetical protein [unclassified Bradyrhizobium]
MTVRIGLFVGVERPRCNPLRPPHPALNVRDDREAPLLMSTERGNRTPISENTKANYFSRRIWTSQISLIAQVNFVLAREPFSRLSRPRRDTLTFSL